jgi:hypothetical protein
MARLVRHAVLVGVLALLALTGCGTDEPTAAEAGETLKAHITQMMKEANARGMQVTDPGGKDIACDEGRVKCTYAVTGRDLTEKSTPDLLNGFLVGALTRVAPYEVVGDPSKPPIRLASEEYKTMVIMESPANGQFGVRGETECLPTS